MLGGTQHDLTTIKKEKKGVGLVENGERILSSSVDGVDLRSKNRVMMIFSVFLLVRNLIFHFGSKLMLHNICTTMTVFSFPPPKP